MKYDFLCPECDKQQACGCSSCIKRFGDNPNRQLVNEDLCSCRHCGHTLDINDWFDIECNALFKAQDALAMQELRGLDK